MNTAEKLSTAARSLDALSDAGPGNVRQISPMTQAVKQELFLQANRPTANLDRMADQARGVIGILEDQRKQLEALRTVQKRGLSEDYKRDTDYDRGEIAELNKTIAALRSDMVDRTTKYEANMDAIDADIDRQIAAVDKMRAAQQAVVEGLSTDVSRPEPEMRTLADVSPAPAKAKRK